MSPVTLADALPSPEPAPRRPRRRAAATAGVVVVAAVVAGGAWAWQAWSSQGPQPAEALPANTLAYLAVDLDPPGGQKVAAYDALRSVPSLKKELGLGSTDDLRESIVDAIDSDGGCDLSWKDVKSWAGDRGAVAVVPQDGLQVVVVLQVSDADKARSGLGRTADDCGGFGFTVGEKWAVLAEDDQVAKQVVSDTKGANLAEDGTFQELTGAAGDPGVLTMYAAPALGKALLDDEDASDVLGFFSWSPVTSLDPVAGLVSSVTFLSAFATDFEGDADGDFDEEFTPEQQRVMDLMDEYEDLTPTQQKQLDADMAKAFHYDEVGPEGDAEPIDEDQIDDELEDLFQVPEKVRKQVENFSGLGGVARFDDGGLELEIVADPFLTGYESTYDATVARDAVAALPADTVLAFGAGFKDGWAKPMVTRGGFFTSGSTDAELVDGFREATGLSPEDLEALGGDSVAFAAKKGFAKALEDEDLAKVTIAARVTGDPAKIEAALAKLAAQDDLGVVAKSVRTDDGVVIGPNPSYLAELVDPDRTLGDLERFQDATADADDAMVITYADFDDSWLPMVSEGDLSPEDAAAFGTTGISVTEDGGRHRLVARVTLD